MTNSRQDTSSTPEPDPPAEVKREKRSGVSATQVTASGMAAATSTAALSYFGVMGTIAGAALGSAITIVGNDVYSRSIKRTAKTVSSIAPVVVQPRATLPLPSTRRDIRRVQSPSSSPANSGVVEPDQAVEVPDRAAVSEIGTNAEPSEANRSGPLARLMAKYGRTKVLIASGVAVFLTVMAAVLLLELLTGKPLSDTVRGREGSGTTLSDIRPLPGDSEDPGGDETPPDEDPVRPPDENEAPREDPDQDTPPDDESDDQTPPEPDEQAPPEPDDDPQPEPEEFSEPEGEAGVGDGGAAQDAESPGDGD